jgi:penicillin-binding protein 1A
MMGDDSNHVLGRHVINDYMEHVHKEVYQPQGKWQPSDQPAKPNGIKTLSINGRTDIWPSWFDAKNSGYKKSTMTFDTISKKKATQCTPASTKVELEVIITTDPVTKKDKTSITGYDPEAEDDVHRCDDAKPGASISVTGTNIGVSFTTGRFALKSYVLYINGAEVSSGTVPASGSLTFPYPTYTNQPISVRVTDAGGYEVTVQYP